ncbi:MAG: hypothetical protein AUK37_04095 [Rhodobacterales bacterium CG2_30_65_12]|nr:MAG: hypothetical protein AUK37_04095 [Rhodobacterales bacterium CG2_30_65_12]
MTAPESAWEAGHAGRRIAVAVIARAWALAMRAWCATWRTDITESARLDAALAAGQPVVAVFWHGNNLPLFSLLAGRRALVVTSQSFRGAVIAGIARAFGYQARQVGAAPHSTGMALRAELARPGGLVGIAVDGPLGPRHVVKPGAVVLAARAGAQIVPIQAIASRSIRLSRRWDKPELPLPGARVVLRVGAPITLTAADGARPEQAAVRVAEALEALTLPDRRPARTG